MRPDTSVDRRFLALQRRPDRDAATQRSPEHEPDATRTPGKRTLVELVYGSELDAFAGAAPAVQRKLAPAAAAPRSDAQVHAAAGLGVSGAATALPFRDLIQSAFGRHDVSRIQAHTDGAARAGAAAMGARAFAAGARIAFAGEPDLHTAAHEAAHVVQQRGGVQLKGGVGDAGDAHERHADAVADKVVRGESAEALLNEYAPAAGAGAGADAVQRKLLRADDGVHYRDDRGGALFTMTPEGALQNAAGETVVYDRSTDQYRTSYNLLYDPVTGLQFEDVGEGRYREVRAGTPYVYDGRHYVPVVAEAEPTTGRADPPKASGDPAEASGDPASTGDEAYKRKREDDPAPGPDGAAKPKADDAPPDDADSESESDEEPAPRFLKRRRVDEVNDEREDPATVGGLVHGLAVRGVLADNHVHLHAAASLGEMETFTTAAELQESIKRLEAFLKQPKPKPKKEPKDKKTPAKAADPAPAAVDEAQATRHALSGEHLATKDGISTGPTALADAVQPKMVALAKAQAALLAAEKAKANPKANPDDGEKAVADARAHARQVFDELGELLQMHKPVDAVYQGVATQTEFFARFLRGQNDIFAKPKGRDDVAHNLTNKRPDTLHGLQEVRRSFSTAKTIHAQMAKDRAHHKARKKALTSLGKAPPDPTPGLHARGRAFVMYGIGKSSMHAGPAKAKDIGWAVTAVQDFYKKTKTGTPEHPDLKGWVGIDSQGQEKGMTAEAETTKGNRLGNMWIPQGLNVLHRAREIRAQLIALKTADGYPAAFTSALGRVLGDRGKANDEAAVLGLVTAFETAKLDAAIGVLEARIKASEKTEPEPFDYAQPIDTTSIRLIDVASQTRAIVGALRAYRAETEDPTKLPRTLGFAPHGGEQLLAVHPVNLLRQMKSDILMGADRIGHGLVLQIERKHLEDILKRGGGKLKVSSEELDEVEKLQKEVLALVREHGVVIEANVTSNMEISNFKLEQHPAKAMLEADVRITVNTDDPTWLGNTVAGELTMLASMGVSRAELARVILDAYYHRMGTRSLSNRGELKQTYKQVLTEGISRSSARQLARHLAKRFGTPVYLTGKQTDTETTLDVVLDAVFGVGLGSLDRALAEGGKAGDDGKDGKDAKAGDDGKDGDSKKPHAGRPPSRKAPDGRFGNARKPGGPRVPVLRNHTAIHVAAAPRLAPYGDRFRAWSTLGGGNCAFNGFAQVLIGLVREGKRTAEDVAAKLGGGVTPEQITNLTGATARAAVSRTAANTIQHNLATLLRGCAAAQLAVRPDLQTLIVSDFATEVRQRVLLSLELTAPPRKTDLFEDPGTAHAKKLDEFVVAISAELVEVLAAADDGADKKNILDLAWDNKYERQAKDWMAATGMVAYLANMATEGVHAGIPELVALGDHFGVLVLTFSGNAQPLEAEYSGGAAPIKLDSGDGPVGRGEVEFLAAEIEVLRNQNLILGVPVDPRDPTLSFRIHTLEEIGASDLGEDLTRRFVEVYTAHYRYLESDPIVVGLHHLGVHWEAVTTRGGAFDLNDSTDRLTALTAAQALPAADAGAAKPAAPGAEPSIEPTEHAAGKAGPSAAKAVASGAFTRPAIPGVNVVYTDITFGTTAVDFDLTKFGIKPADGQIALVNAANTALLGGGGIDKAVHNIGGQSALDSQVNAWKQSNPARLKAGNLPAGNAMATTGGQRKDLTQIIHAVGPDLTAGESIMCLDTCVEQILMLAKAAGINTLIMCHLSGAIFVKGSSYTPDDTAHRIVAAFPAAMAKVGYTPTKLIMNRFPGAPPVSGIVVPIGDAKTLTS